MSPPAAPLGRRLSRAGGARAAQALSLALGVTCLGAVGCTSEPSDKAGASDAIVDPELEFLVLSMGPLPAMSDNPTNQVADDELAAHFGQWLFFDTRLSESGEFSCASCHDPELGFGDGLPLSEAAGTTSRHAPSLWNTGFQRWQFWDGRCDTLWCQATGPIEADHEMGLSRTALAQRFGAEGDLRDAYTEVFGAPPALTELLDGDRFPLDARPVPDDPEDPRAVAWAGMAPADQDAVTEVLVNVAKAIEAYERRLVTQRAPIDAFVDAVEAEDHAAADAALSPEAQQGLALFVGEGSCVFCHSGPLFTNLEFHNIGLPTPEWLDGLDAGRYDGIDALRASEFHAGGAWSDEPGGDQAARLDRIAQTAEQLAQFKVPGLRRVDTSAPYFHGGHKETLEDVVRFYSEAPETDAPGHREELIVPLDWTDDEISAVVRFLIEGLGGGAPDPALLQAPTRALP